MRFTVVAFALVISGLSAQDTKKAGGPAPPTLEQPGAHHPMPIPRQNPVVPPDVRSPQHETGKERPVAKEGAKKEAGTKQTDTKQTDTKQTEKSRTSAAPAKSEKSQSDSKR